MSSFYEVNDSFVSMDNHRSKSEQRQYEEELIILNTLKFAVNMLAQALFRKDREFDTRHKGHINKLANRKTFQGSIDCVQVAKCRDGDVPFIDDRGHHVRPNDFIVYELHHPRRRFGYIRPETGNANLFMPYNRDAERVAKLAFDPDFVAQFYPKR